VVAVVRSEFGVQHSLRFSPVQAGTNPSTPSVLQTPPQHTPTHHKVLSRPQQAAARLGAIAASTPGLLVVRLQAGGDALLVVLRLVVGGA
jgi:hypothetical protein